MIPLPNNIKQEDNPPNKKYFNPADVADSLSLYKVAKIYTAKDCNSILKYIEIKSLLETNNAAPKVVNKIIKEYSLTLGEINLLIKLGEDALLIKLKLYAQGTKIKAPIK
jgi:hypothetical protein